VKPGLEVKVDRLKEVLTALEGLTLDRVYVGVPEKTAGKRTDKESGERINNAQLARIHEYGAPAAHIPPRPFLVPGIMHAHDQIAGDLREGARKCLDDLNPNAAEQALKKAGSHAAAQVQQEFTDNSWEPLAESTLEARWKKLDMDAAARRLTRKAKKENWSDDKWDEEFDKAVRQNPLIDTGSLRASISYVVRKKG
jgi:hypothetical protein